VRRDHWIEGAIGAASATAFLLLSGSAYVSGIELKDIVAAWGSLCGVGLGVIGAIWGAGVVEDRKRAHARVEELQLLDYALRKALIAVATFAKQVDSAPVDAVEIDAARYYTELETCRDVMDEVLISATNTPLTIKTTIRSTHKLIEAILEERASFPDDHPTAAVARQTRRSCAGLTQALSAILQTSEEIIGTPNAVLFKN
jgi:hypothetical protein